MNRDHTLALFAKGRKHWNAWADQMLADKEKLIAAGSWEDGNQLKPTGSPTRLWEERAAADFDRHRFDADVDFQDFRFPGTAKFEGATFSRRAFFNRAEFVGIARFNQATFLQGCDFTSAKFPGLATFTDTTFHSRAIFLSNQFHQGVHFDQATFEDAFHFNQSQCRSFSFEGASVARIARLSKTKIDGKADFRRATFSEHFVLSECVFCDDATLDHANFRDAAYIVDSSFKKNAQFKAVSGKCLFLTHVDFAQLPDFSAAHFDEAPQFTGVSLEPSRFAKDPNQFPERWRALRRLATQDRDHELELRFFEGEIRARRGSIDKCTHLRFWAGWAYQLLSGFGQSMTRPLIGLTASIVFFAALYLCASDGAQSALTTSTCIPGSAETLVAAATLSLHRAFPFAGIGSSGKAEHIYACLYGLRTRDQSEHSLGTGPVIPDSVAIAAAAQFFISALLIFLFVLAIRNHFRIR